jgi:hypothetical protein
MVILDLKFSHKNVFTKWMTWEKIALILTDGLSLSLTHTLSFTLTHSLILSLSLSLSLSHSLILSHSRTRIFMSALINFTFHFFAKNSNRDKIFLFDFFEEKCMYIPMYGNAHNIVMPQTSLQ